MVPRPEGWSPKKDNTPIKQLGIDFGDNDFYFTLIPFMKLLIPDDSTHHSLVLPSWSKEQVVELFNNLAFGIYLLKQNGWRYNNSDADHAHIKKYLRITEEQVFIDEEVKAFMERDEGSHLNGEFFAVDFNHRYVWSA